MLPVIRCRFCLLLLQQKSQHSSSARQSRSHYASMRAQEINLKGCVLLVIACLRKALSSCTQVLLQLQYCSNFAVGVHRCTCRASDMQIPEMQNTLHAKLLRCRNTDVHWHRLHGKHSAEDSAVRLCNIVDGCTYWLLSAFSSSFQFTFRVLLSLTTLYNSANPAIPMWVVTGIAFVSAITTC